MKVTYLPVRPDRFPVENHISEPKINLIFGECEKNAYLVSRSLHKPLASTTKGASHSPDDRHLSSRAAYSPSFLTL